MTNSEIVLELQQGKTENFQLLYDNTINYSVCIARKYLGERDMDVEDIVQDSYVSALKHINELEDQAKFDKWLGRIVANRALNWKRDKLSKVYELTIDNDENPMDFEDDRVNYNPSLVADKKATAEVVNGILALIPEAQRDVLLMFYGQQYSIKEISDSIGKPENTIKTWLRRGRQNIEAHKQDFIKQGITLTGISVFVLIKTMFDTDTSMAMQLGASGLAATTTANFLSGASSAAGISAATGAGSATSAGASAVAGGTGMSAATGAGSAASAGAAGATTVGGATVGAAAAHAAGGALVTKIAAGVAAVAVIGGGAYGITNAVSPVPETKAETTAALEVIGETDAVEETMMETIEETVAELPNAELNRQVLAEYRKILMEDTDFMVDEVKGVYPSFGVVDIDKDGIYELDIYNGEYHTYLMAEYLLYYNEVAQKVEKITSGVSGIGILPDKQFYSYYVHGGITFDLFEKQNGEWIRTEELYGELDFDGNIHQDEKIDEYMNSEISSVDHVELNEKNIEKYLSDNGISTEVSKADREKIDKLISEIDESVLYTDSHEDAYQEYYGDYSADPWGQYDSRLQSYNYCKKGDIVVKNTIWDNDIITCYRLNPDINPGTENGKNPEDTAIYIKAEDFNGNDDYIEYEFYLNDGKIFLIRKEGRVLGQYLDGADIQSVYEEYKDDWGHLLESAFPGALGIDYDPAWIAITIGYSDTDNTISFDGSKYVIKSYENEYVIDKDTMLDSTDENFYLPEYQDGDTAMEWFTRCLNTEKDYMFANYVVKMTGNHIDTIQYAFWPC
ncbi:RNA polymerase sigma factor [Oribacterium sp. FC2011]|uniref:RNA polymerase sigma factor n=1 Tax=Oribacterium sp. FC2011 TaxID=1408311 RepID=UPI0004E25BE8|nr:sigma-70 family RNA polymerase sigma factor [Oribacterium sp. FC2011]